MGIDWRKFWRMFWKAALGMILFYFVVFFSIFFWVKGDLPPMSEIENPQLDLSTQIYSADGELIGSIYGNANRVFVPLDEMSPHIKNALLATEDIRFYDHSGIDPGTIPSMIYRNFFKGQKSGGSGLTQQLARNLYQQVGRQNSLGRKTKEALVAIFLEARFTKDQIMQAYLNTSGFYGNTYGIEMGARTLFGKHASEVELHQAALLIGLLKNPTYYSPTRNAERATQRRNVVLGQMAKYDFISEAEADSAKARPLDLHMNKQGVERALAPYFRDEVKRFLVDWNDETGGRYDLYSDGLKVYTTLDSRLQGYAEKAIQEHLSELQQDLEKEWKRIGTPWNRSSGMLEAAMKKTTRYAKGIASGTRRAEVLKSFEEKQEMTIWTWEGMRDTTMTPKDSLIHYLKYLETGFVAIDPKGGEVRAYVGGNDYGAFKYDHVTQGRRQVGSTIKPIVYAAAMGHGRHLPCEHVLDQPITIELPDGNVWQPSNSGGGDDGLISYSMALALSKNQVTAALMKEIGPEKVCELAQQLGIESPLDCKPALALGTSDISVMEMVAAYSAFANYGMYSKPYYVTRIEDKHGNILATFGPDQRQAIDTTTAFMIIQMMRGVVDQPKGTAHRLRWKYKFDGQIAGKTGTTQRNTDGWFIGATPNLVAGAWVGGSDQRIRFRSTRYGQGANMALPIWAGFMTYVYANKDLAIRPGDFKKPISYQINHDCRPPDTPVYPTDTLPDDLPPEWVPN